MKKIIIVAIILISIIGIGIACLFGYNLQTRYVVLKNAEGQQLVFLGAMHCGTSSYFQKLQNILDHFSGVVLYEAVRDGDGLEPVMQSYKLMANLFDVPFQGDAIQYRPEWLLSDITMPELEKSINMEEIRDQDEMINKWIQDKNKSRNPKAKMYFYKDITEIVSLFVNWFPNDPLITVRNIKPIQDAEKLLEDGNSVLIFYGDAHKHEIIDHFKKAGFKKVSEKHFKVF